MGFTDKVKGLLKGREQQVKQGIDKASDVAERKLGAQHASKIDGVAEKAKDFVDDLGGQGDRPGPTEQPPTTPPAPPTT